MGHKRPFDEVMREFATEYADELDHLTPEQIAERTGYSLSIVRDYLRRQQTARLQEEQRKEAERIRALEAGATTYIASSGSARVVYFPLLGETRISSRHPKNWDFQTWGRGYSQREEGTSLFLSSQDTLEIGIYLMGLQPHIRDVLARVAKGELHIPIPEQPTPPDDSEDDM